MSNEISNFTINARYKTIIVMCINGVMVMSIIGIAEDGVDSIYLMFPSCNAIC